MLSFVSQFNIVPTAESWMDMKTHLIVNETISGLRVGGCWRWVRSHSWTKFKILLKFLKVIVHLT